MRKFLRLYILICLCSMYVGAEAVRYDSIATFVVPGDQLEEMYDRKVASPVGINLLSRGNFNRSTIEYGRESGRLIRVQTPEKAHRLKLKSIGLYSTERWQLYGEFAYSRNFEDSVQWLLSEPPKNGMPYYFGSPRKGNWETETYDIKGTFSINLTPLFVAGAAAKINYFKGTRSNDPRPSAKSFVSDYYLFGGISTPRFSVLVVGGLGYGTRDNDIVYTNSDNDRNLRLDMMAYELMGWGMNRKTQQFQNRSLETNIYTRHLAMQVRWKIDSLCVWARMSHDHQRDSIRRSRTVNVSRSLLSTYTAKITYLDAGVSLPLNNDWMLQSQATIKLTKGYDNLVNVLQGQKNYVYESKDTRLYVLLDNHSNPRQTDKYGFSLGYGYERRKEGASEHTYERKGMDGNVSWNRQQALHSSYYILYGLRQGMLFPTATLTYPDSQENIFTTDLAIPIRDYEKTSQGYSTLNIGAGKTFGQYNLLFSIRYNIAYALGNSQGVKGTRHHLDAAFILSF